MKNNLKGSSVLLTGGGSGLGRALVERFVSEGARVGVLEISLKKAAALREQFGEAVRVTIGDASSFADNAQAVADTLESFGKLDCFIGNAAVWDFGVPLSRLEPQVIGSAFDELFGLNVRGYLLGAKASLSALTASGGSMIFTLSNAAFYPGGGGPLYTAAKHAVVGLIKQLAYELAPRVRVNGVAPGGMATDLRGLKSLGMGEQSFGQFPVQDILEIATPLAVRATPEDYTGHYVLLASSYGRTVTGEVYRCDGGVGIRGRREAERLAADMGLGGQ